MVPGDPGANGWIGNPNPITMVGDVAWQTYTVSVDARIVPPSLSRVGAASPGLLMAPCQTGDRGQQWVWDVPARGYLQNARSYECLNVFGCQSEIIQYACVTQGGTCCGPACYGGLQFVLDAATGHLQSRLSNATCVTVQPDASLQLAACQAGSSAQQFRYDAASHQLRSADGRCVSLPALPSLVAVGGWVSAFNPFARDPWPGVYLAFNNTGGWSVTGNGIVLADGHMLAPFDPTAFHRLTLELHANGTVAAAIDERTLATVQTAPGSGQAAVGSGYHYAQFDNFQVGGGGARED